MSHPDHALWKQGWRANETAFHLDHVHPLLIRFWPSLGLHRDDRVFVPLCGKSLDLMWLHGQGHDIAGVELSPIAVRKFFKASRLHPKRRQTNELTCWTHERLAIYCGDFFELTRDEMSGVRAVYDRAALSALPEDLREYYIAHLHAILPDDCRILLLTIEDIDDGEMVSDTDASAEIANLYAGYFSIETVHAEHHAAKPGKLGRANEPRCVHKVYRLRRMTTDRRSDTVHPVGPGGLSGERLEVG